MLREFTEIKPGPEDLIFNLKCVHCGEPLYHREGYAYSLWCATCCSFYVLAEHPRVDPLLIFIPGGHLEEVPCRIDPDEQERKAASMLGSRRMA